MAPDEPDHGRERRGTFRTLYPTVDFGVGQREQFLECNETRIVKTGELRIGETSKDEIHFLRAAMMRTIERAFHPGLKCCHGDDCADAACGCPT
jgi:hypothetical protein